MVFGGRGQLASRPGGGVSLELALLTLVLAEICIGVQVEMPFAHARGHWDATHYLSQADMIHLL